MSFEKENINSTLLSPALSGGLEHLTYLIDAAQGKRDLYDFFSHLCNFVIPYIRQSNYLRPLRNQWEQTRKEHIRTQKKLEKQVILEIKNACLIIHEEVGKGIFDGKDLALKELCDIQGILKTGGHIYSPRYYEVAAIKLVQTCYTLTSFKYPDVLSGIVEKDAFVGFDASSNTFALIKGVRGEYIHFCKTLRLLYSHLEKSQRLITDESWIIWQRLHLAELSWHLPHSYFETQGFQIGSPKKAQKSNSLFRLYTYWNEMQRIRLRRPPQEGDSCFFIPDEYLEYLKNIVSEIVCWKGLNDERFDLTEILAEKPFYAIGLKLDGNHIYIMVEHEKDGESETLLLHKCQDGTTPLNFIRALLQNIGKNISLSDYDRGNQSVAKILSNIKIKGPLHKIFFSESTTHKTALNRTKVILDELPKKDAVEVTEYIKNLGLTQLDGEFESINHEKINKTKKRGGENNGA